MKVRVVEAESLAVTKRLQALLDEVTQLRAEVAQLRAENAELRSEVARLTAENADLRATVARLVTENTALQAENAQLRAENGDLRAHVAALEAANAQLVARVAELTARLGQNSTNSSRPPSTDPPGTPPPPPRTPSGRKPGGQPGHVAHQFQPVPPEQVDEVVDHWPSVCGHCQAALEPDLTATDAEPVVHQVIELPPVQVRVTEHRLHRQRCPHCRAWTRATLPPDVPTGHYGPRLQATVGVLSGRYRVSRREVAQLAGDVLGAPLSVGQVDALCQATAAALAGPMAELEAAVKTAAAANVDETGWARGGKRRVLWVVVTAVATVFAVALSRGGDVLKELVGADFAGRVGSDRWSAYRRLPPERRQVCWAHLKRDFQALVEWGGAARPVGEAALGLIAHLFAVWHRARDEPTGRDRLVQEMAPIQAAFRTLLEGGVTNPVGKAAGLCRSLLALWPALWTFVTVPGVEPTNNAAERALRPAVLWRKGSFGTRSDRGDEFVERMLSVAATCALQQRPLFDYLVAVCTAAQRGQPIPSPLPTPATPSPP